MDRSFQSEVERVKGLVVSGCLTPELGSLLLETYSRGRNDAGDPVDHIAACKMVNPRYKMTMLVDRTAQLDSLLGGKKLRIPTHSEIHLIKDWEHLPEREGVYAFVRDGELLYVGISNNFHRRLRERANMYWTITASSYGPHLRDDSRYPKLKGSDQMVLWFGEGLRELEQSLILTSAPKHNTAIDSAELMRSNTYLRKSGFSREEIDSIRKNYVRMKYGRRRKFAEPA